MDRSGGWGVVDALDLDARVEQVPVVPAEQQVPEPELSERRERVVDAQCPGFVSNFFTGPTGFEQILLRERLARRLAALIRQSLQDQAKRAASLQAHSLTVRADEPATALRDR